MLGGGDQGSDGGAFKDAQLDDDDLDGGDAGGGWGIDELDLPESPGQALAGGKGTKSSAFLPPSPGDAAVAIWLSNANAAGETRVTAQLLWHQVFRSCVNPSTAGDMAAAADLAGVARTLKHQAGVRSLAPLKDALALLAQANLPRCITFLNRPLPFHCSSVSHITS
jgi:hypothetical protein